jgi:xanthine dehydrogenase small subunit
MPVTVKSFSTIGEAASALASDRGARYLGGGTLVMRALNEGDVARPAGASLSAPA